MKRYNPTTEDEELYSQPVKRPASATPAAAEDMPSNEGEEPTDAQSTDEETSATENSALVSNKVLRPDGSTPKEGDEVTMKVIKCYGDECEVSCSPKSTAPEKEPMSADSEIEAMDEEGM
jgi:hypothetical protein